MSTHRDAAQLLIEAINCTGGLVLLYDATYAPRADMDWIDLADAYLKACAEKGVEPVISPESDAIGLPLPT